MFTYLSHRTITKIVLSLCLAVGVLFMFVSGSSSQADAASTVSYACSTGWTLAGSQCYATIVADNTAAKCAANKFTWTDDSCRHYINATPVDTTATPTTAPTTGTVPPVTTTTGGTYVTPTTTPATVVYSCSPGWALSGTRCYAIVVADNTKAKCAARGFTWTANACRRFINATVGASSTPTTTVPPVTTTTAPPTPPTTQPVSNAPTPTPVITGGTLTKSSFTVRWSDSSTTIGRAQLNVYSSYFAGGGCKGLFVALDNVSENINGTGTISGREFNYPGSVKLGSPVATGYYYANLEVYDPDVPGSHLSNCYYLGHN
jgi:hypothetical protein